MQVQHKTLVRCLLRKLRLTSPSTIAPLALDSKPRAVFRRLRRALCILQENLELSKMLCTCGGIISDVQYPCDTEGELIGQWNWELMHDNISEKIASYIQAIESGTEENWLTKYYGETSFGVPEHQAVISNILSDELLKHEKSVAECEECGRLWIQEAPYTNKYIAFSPDNGNYNAVCKKIEPKDA